jgi:lipoprotein-releasing system permease protein
LNLEYFIAKRLIKGGEHKISISAPIIKIAIAAIALGIIMMLIAIATGVGLKQKIREKVAAFNGHIQIYNYDSNISDVSVIPVSTEQEFYPNFNSVAGIALVTLLLIPITYTTATGFVTRLKARKWTFEAWRARRDAPEGEEDQAATA